MIAWKLNCFQFKLCPTILGSQNAVTDAFRFFKAFFDQICHFERTTIFNQVRLNSDHWEKISYLLISLSFFLLQFFELTFSIFSLFCSNFHFLSFALHCLDKIFCKSGLHHVSLRISLIKSGSSQNKRKTYFCANCKFSSWNFKAFCKNKKCEHQHIFAPKAWSDQKCTRTKATIECSPGFHALGKRSFEVYHF